jgi:hypothetical protein
MSKTQQMAFICNRLTALGYAQHKKIRLYGEELELVADASPDGEGFAVEGVAHKSGKITRMHIPLTVVNMLRQELKSAERLSAA